MCCEVLNNVILEAQIDEFFHLHSMANVAKYRCGAVESVEEGALTNDLILMEGFMDNLKTTLSNVWTAIVQIFHEIKEFITRTVKTLYQKIKSWIAKNFGPTMISVYTREKPQDLLSGIVDKCASIEKMIEKWDQLYKNDDYPTEKDISAFEFLDYKLQITTDSEGEYKIELPSVQNSDKFKIIDDKFFRFTFSVSDAAKFSEQLNGTIKYISKLETRAKANCHVRCDNPIKTRYLQKIAIYIARCISEYVYYDYQKALDLMYNINKEINKNENT